MFKVRVDGGQAIRLLDVRSYHPLWSPDGRFIVYAEEVQLGILQAKGMTPDGAPVRLPAFWVSQSSPNPYRFVPNRQEIVFLKSAGDSVQATQNFEWVNLETGQQRQLTNWRIDLRIQELDLSPDGKQILFDRFRENSDIVLIDLAR